MLLANKIFFIYFAVNMQKFLSNFSNGSLKRKFFNIHNCYSCFSNTFVFMLMIFPVEKCVLRERLNERENVSYFNDKIKIISINVCVEMISSSSSPQQYPFHHLNAFSLSRILISLPNKIYIIMILHCECFYILQQQPPTPNHSIHFILCT